MSLALTSLIAVFSVGAKAQIGLQLRIETAKRYANYPGWAFLRLVFWTGLVLFWMSLIGGLATISAANLLGTYPPVWLVAVGGLAGIVLISGLQYVRQLIWMPGGLMIATSRDLSGLNPLWRRLSVSRVRWLLIFTTLLLSMPVLLWITELMVAEAHASAGALILLAALCALPIIWETMPRHSGPSKDAIGQTGSPNVLMIGCDTLRSDTLGCFGSGLGVTPFLDALAARGSSFSRCYTPITRTAPSIASWFTGRWPQRLNIRCDFVSDETTNIKTPTLASELSAAGYETAVISDWSGSDFDKFSFGFKDVDVPPDRWNLKYLIRQGPKGLRRFLCLFTHSKFGRAFLPELYFLTGIPVSHHLVKKSLNKIDQLGGGEKPWFLNIFLGTVQPPFVSRYPYYTLYSDAAYEGLSGYVAAGLSDPLEIIPRQRGSHTISVLEQIRALYHGCVRAFDDQVRQLVQHLRKRGLADNTVIVIYSIRGMEFTEQKNNEEDNRAINDSDNCVPLIIVDPRYPRGQICAEVVRTVDLLPTLLELCSVDPPSGLDGVAFTDYVTGSPSVGTRSAFCEKEIPLSPLSNQLTGYFGYHDAQKVFNVADMRTGTISLSDEAIVRSDRSRVQAVIEGEWQLIHKPSIDGGSYSLYHLNAYSTSPEDLIETQPERAQALAQKLADWMLIGGGRLR